MRYPPGVLRSTVVAVGLAALIVAAAPTSPRAAPLRVPILVYHSVVAHKPGETADRRQYEVAPEVFETQMTYLRDHHLSVVPLAALVGALTGRGTLPDRAVVITFDDGWENQFTHAVPVLRRFGYTATFFIFPNPVSRDARFMTWEQLRELLAAGMTIGSHSRTHPLISSVHGRALADEVGGSKALLEQKLGGPIAFFAYPFGAHPPEVEAAVRDAGYLAARGFPGGPWNDAAHVWALRSVRATDNLIEFRENVAPPAVRGVQKNGPAWLPMRALEK
jgi:peptidoglycan/xylan/chitin deacetylase (PgdA/CDA1 family)